MKQRLKIVAFSFGLLAISLICAFLTSLIVKGINRRIIDERLAELAVNVASQVKERITTYQYGLRGARGLIIGTTTENLSYQSFREYSESRDLEKEFPGSRGFGYIVRVSPNEIEDFVRNAQADGRPYFSISQLTTHDGDLFIILYVEPENLNKEAVGLDIASENSRRQTAITAMNTGEVALTPPITLVQASGKRLGGFLLMLPVYKNGTYPKTKEEREIVTVGWAYTPIVIDEVLQSLRYQRDDYFLQLYDVPTVDGIAENQTPQVIDATISRDGWVEFFSSYEHAPIKTIELYAGIEQREAEILFMDIFSRRWGVEVSPTAGFIKRLNLQNPIALGGIVAAFSALLGSATLLLTQVRLRVKNVQLSNKRIAMLVENSSDAIVGTTRSGIISSWNRSAERLFGYSVSEAIGQIFCLLAVPKSEKKNEEARLKAVVSGIPQNSYQTKCINKFGNELDVSIVMGPIFNSSQQVIGVTRTIRDIGESKSFEARLIALNNSLEAQVAERTAILDEQNKKLALISNNLRLIIEAAPYALVMVDSDGKVEVFNTLAERIFGYTKEELAGKPIELLLPPQYRDSHVLYRTNFFIENRPRPMGQGRDLYALRKDHSTFPAEIGLNPIETPDGTKVIAAVIDITQRKEQERMIQEFSAFQNAILSYAGFALIATSKDGIITLFNPEAEHMLGYKAQEVVGIRGPEIFHLQGEIDQRSETLSEELGIAISKNFEALIGKAQRGVTDEYECTYVRKGGTTLPVLLRVSALLNKAENVIGYLTISMDLTERNENARKLALYSEHLSEIVAERTRELEVAQQKLLSQERLERELHLAAEIQEALGTKKPPNSDRYDMAIFAKPARFVSGDIYDVIVNSKNTVSLFLADISGKGVPAALMTTAARALFRQSVRKKKKPAGIYTEIKKELASDLAHNELFMTCQISEFDYQKGSIFYKNAGHTETLIHRAKNGSTDFFVPTNLPIGIEAPRKIEELEAQQVHIIPGDVLVFYSDGLTETTNGQEAQFGVQRLVDALAKSAPLDAQEIMDHILSSIKDYCGEKQADDDTSVIVVKVRPSTIEKRWREPALRMDVIVQSLIEPCKGYGEFFSYEFELVVTELLSNIYRHSYGEKINTENWNGKGKVISTKLHLAEDGVVLDVFDFGRPLPEGVLEKAGETPHSLAEGGYGLSIIRSLTEAFSYQRLSPNKNHWRMSKRRGANDESI